MREKTAKFLILALLYIVNFRDKFSVVENSFFVFDLRKRLGKKFDDFIKIQCFVVLKPLINYYHIGNKKNCQKNHMNKHYVCMSFHRG